MTQDPDDLGELICVVESKLEKHYSRPDWADRIDEIEKLEKKYSHLMQLQARALGIEGYEYHER